ncbi:hypothetical protein GCM10008932_08490 [Alkalibacterium iburiense]|uniref:Uncharacterized protein n=1 Tax=Alkalibacterium iburiense TaxID=290589 RepID=A0ABP3H1N5_9LACT
MLLLLRGDEQGESDGRTNEENDEVDGDETKRTHKKSLSIKGRHLVFDAHS